MGDNKLYENNRLSFFQQSQNNIIPKKELHIYSAGVLPFQIDNNEIYICLGKDRNGLWSDFGGKVDTKDRLNIKETAAREFYEESYGSILSLQAIKTQLRDNNNFTLINSESMSGIRYYMFLLQVPKVDTIYEQFHKTYEYLKYINAEYQYQEKVDIGWITLDNLLILLENSEKVERKMDWPLKKVFKRTLCNYKNILMKIKHKEEIYL